MMKTPIRIKEAWNLMMLIAILTTAASCSGDDDGVITEDEIPELTISVTDCPVENIEMIPVVKVTGNSRRWFVEVEVTIKCMGEPVNEAELKLKWGWIEQAIKIKTDENGKAKARRRVSSEPKPTGSVTVTIEGSDDSKEMKVDF
jgi:hypothetical protein